MPYLVSVDCLIYLHALYMRTFYSPFLLTLYRVAQKGDISHFGKKVAYNLQQCYIAKYGVI